jgi:hypothetical protein
LEQAAQKVVEQAASRGWEAGLLALIMLFVIVGAGYLIRFILADAAQRETRLTERLNRLEEYVQTTLLEEVRETRAALVASQTASKDMSAVVAKLSEALAARPCFWTAEKQRELTAKA